MIRGFGFVAGVVEGEGGFRLLGLSVGRVAGCRLLGLSVERVDAFQLLGLFANVVSSVGLLLSNARLCISNGRNHLRASLARSCLGHKLAGKI